jgi:ribosomal protein L14E/L6E/L27E
MDFAIAKLEGEFIPSAIKFRNLCNQGPHIPTKEVLQIVKQATQADKQAALEAKEKAKKWLEKHKWRTNESSSN